MEWETKNICLQGEGLLLQGLLETKGISCNRKQILMNTEISP